MVCLIVRPDENAALLISHIILFPGDGMALNWAQLSLLNGAVGEVREV